MPPLFTSTALTSFFRQVLTAAKHVPVSGIAPRVSGGAAIKGAASAGPLHRARLVVQKIAQQTFPSLSTPSHHLAYALEPIRLNPRNLSRKGPIANRFSSTSAFRTAYRLPINAPRGPAMASSVGLGSARTFASGPAQPFLQAQVPMTLRALASLLGDEDDKLSPLHAIPRASRYRPYVKAKRMRRVERGRTASIYSYASIDSSFDHFSAYLLFPRRAEQVVPLPPTPETFVTPGDTTTLYISLSPSLDAILEATTNIPYEAAALGVTVLPDLLKGVMEIMEAFETHAHHRVLPLLYKLESLAVSIPQAYPSFDLELERDDNGRMAWMRLVFHDRSSDNVRAILGESLREEEAWWGLDTVTVTVTVQPGQQLSPQEQHDIAPEWPDDPEHAAVARPIQVELPTLDASVNPPPDEVWTSSGANSGYSTSMTESVVDSYEASGVSSGFASPGSDLSDSDASSNVSYEALQESLASLVEASEPDWTVPPGPDDEVQSATPEGMNGSQEWEADEAFVFARARESRPPSPMVPWI